MATPNDNTAILFLILTRAKVPDQLNLRALLQAGREDWVVGQFDFCSGSL